MKNIKRDFSIRFRVTKDEREAIREKAKLAGLTESEYVRRRALNFQITSKAELKVLNELRRQGGLIKHLHDEAQGMYSAEFSAALNAFTDYIHALERKLS